MARTMTAKMEERLRVYLSVSKKMEAVDDRKLLWLLKTTIFLPLDIEAFSCQDALVGILDDRLYPEYDGKNVLFEDWGWSTPDGPLIYDQKEWDRQKPREENVNVSTTR